jgi:hypothetical protein
VDVGKGMNFGRWIIVLRTEVLIGERAEFDRGFGTV